MPLWIDGGPRRSRRARITRAAAVTAVPVAIAVGVAGGMTASNPTDVVNTQTTVTFVGSGNGHGRGMGQWGAFGYATQGWTAERILAHFYGNTTAGRVDPATPITVRLGALRTVDVSAPAGALVAGQRIAPGDAVHLDGRSAIITRGCAGPPVRTIPAPDQTVRPIDPGRSRPAAEVLRFCPGTRLTTVTTAASDDPDAPATPTTTVSVPAQPPAYRGSLTLRGGAVFTTVALDDYLRGVIPAESPASWADQGGFEALRAQAVAARSYAVATAPARGDRFDDTQASQVYAGFLREDPRTDRAVAATAGQVRMRGGKPIATEFSSSTGGYTAGGVFPAVPDSGDRVSPYHRWQQTVPAARIAAAYDIGVLKSIRVVRKQGAGVPRAEEVQLVGTRGTKTVSGDDVRGTLKLKSDMFVIQTAPPPKTR